MFCASVEIYQEVRKQTHRKLKLQFLDGFLEVSKQQYRYLFGGIHPNKLGSTLEEYTYTSRVDQAAGAGLPEFSRFRGHRDAPDAEATYRAVQLPLQTRPQNTSN